MQNSGKGEHPAGAENILPQKGECRSEDKAPCKQAKNAEYKVGQSAGASQSSGGDYRTGYGHKAKAEEEAAASQTQIAVNRMIQRAVLEVLEEDGLRYQSFVSLQQNQSGETTALITDTVLINRLQGELLDYARRQGLTAGPVFCTRNGKGMSRTQVTEEIQTLCHDARVEEEKGTPRCLRKLYLATQAEVERGVRLLAEQSYERMLDTEQLAAGWAEGTGHSIHKDVYI